MEISKEEAKIVLNGLENSVLNFPVRASDVLNNTIKTDQVALPADFKAFYDRIKTFVDETTPEVPTAEVV